jgi:osmotically-inducible protein OsmY
MKTDTDLQREIAEEIAYKLGRDIGQISVLAQDGMVTLTGHVCCLTQKWLAEYTAMYIYGVQAIANNIDVWLSTTRPQAQTNSTAAQRAVCEGRLNDDDMNALLRGN